MRQRFLFVMLLWLLPSTLLAAGSDEDLRRFVEQVNAASTSFFASGSEADAREKCVKLLDQDFDVPAMAQYALGKGWDSASEQQREAFIEAFKQLIVTEYLRRTKTNGTTLTFIGARPPLQGDRLAASRFAVPGKPDQSWIWRLRPEGDSWRIVDLLVDGHSAVFAERTQYGQILDANQGDINAVIGFIKSQIARGI